MDLPPSQQQQHLHPSSTVLLDRANANIAHLLRRFENLIAYSAEESGQDRLAAGVGVLGMGGEGGGLIRAAEDILSLTRLLKEAWLFGQLRTVDTVGEEEERGEGAREGVRAGLERLRRVDGGEEGRMEEG